MIKILKRRKLNFIFFILFTAMSLTSLPSKDEASGGTTIQYLLLVAFMIITLITGGLKQLLLKKINYNFIDLIPLLIFGVWMYGVFVGLINNVPQKYIFRNFGGMVFYLIFYFFYITKLSVYSIIKSVFFNAYIGIPVIFYLTYLAFTQGNISGIGGERVIFCFLQLIIFIPFVIIFGTFFFSIGRNNKYLLFTSKGSLIIIFLISYFTSVIISFSKGMILASFIIMALIIIFRFLKGFSLNVIIKIFSTLLLFAGILVYFELTDTLIELFSNREVSNATRSEQSVYLIDDISFFGRGLGASLTNANYIRADDAPYAFELTYLNLLHKFGFMACLLFFIYIYTFWKIFKMFGNNDKRNFLGLLCLGLMVFVFPSIGNPFLLSPLAVICHSLTLYIIKISNTNLLNKEYGEATI
ncbi:hypothetical protein [Chryseobacterium sp.]|uniref:hypothetical protein n=1 Tax=Chryseobacterium sp. TaxID=1871047 RepID=UPI00388DF560